jgi:hypothetical protein
MTELTLPEAKVIINALTRVIEANAKTIGELEHKLERKVFADEQKRKNDRPRDDKGHFAKSYTQPLIGLEPKSYPKPNPKKVEKTK